MADYEPYRMDHDAGDGFDVDFHLRDDTSIPAFPQFDDEPPNFVPKEIPVQNLPDGWVWEMFDDGSGALRGPNDETYFDYDTQTYEMTNIYGRWSSLDGNIRDATFRAQKEAELARHLGIQNRDTSAQNAQEDPSLTYEKTRLEKRVQPLREKWQKECMRICEEKTCSEKTR